MDAYQHSEHAICYDSYGHRPTATALTRDMTITPQHSLTGLPSRFGYNSCSQSIPNILFQSSTSLSTQSDDFVFTKLYPRSKSNKMIPSLHQTESASFLQWKSNKILPAANNNIYCYTANASNSSTKSSLSIKIQPSMIKSCPNLVHNRCKCKTTLIEDKAAQRIWSNCYRINVYNEYNEKMDDREIEVTYFDGLYTNLCEYFRYATDSDRVPIKSDISESIQYFGGFVVEGKDLMIDRCHFISFWKWFCGTCCIIKDIYSLWDTKFPLQLNLFMNRSQCQSILQITPTGTFIVRLSQSQPNGIILCYTEPTFNRNANIRNVLLIRHSSQHYATKNMKQSEKSSDLNSIIRNFVKLKFVYSPKYIYKKSHVF